MIPGTSHIFEQPLAIPVDTVRFIVDKLHEYENTGLLADASEASETEPTPLDCENVDVYTERENDYRNEPIRQELESFIDDLPDDYQVGLVALMWLGRDNGSAEAASRTATVTVVPSPRDLVRPIAWMAISSMPVL